MKSMNRTSTAPSHQSLVRTSRLDNGVTVLTESMPGQRGAVVGVWVGLGSRHDPKGKAGLAHLFEHMVFKGTAKRSALRISRELEEVGGSLNAWTSREHTCFYAKVLEDDVPRAVALLCDMVAAARLSPRDLTKERLVVLEEVRSCEDDPDELVGDLFAQSLWADQPLGEPISGSIESVERLTQEDLIAHQERILGADVPVCVSAAGAVDHDHLTELVRKGLARKLGGPRKQKSIAPGKKQTTLLVKHKDVSQVSLILSRRSVSVDHPDRHALALLNLVLGGGMASRLNQVVREKHGLCYSIYSFQDFLLGSGAIGVSLSTEPKQAAKALALVRKEIERLADGDITAADLEFARHHAKGSTLLALESPSARMQHLGKSQFLYGGPVSLDDIEAHIDGVTLEIAQRVAREQFTSPGPGNGWTLSAVHPEGIELPWE